MSYAMFRSRVCFIAAAVRDLHAKPVDDDALIESAAEIAMMAGVFAAMHARVQETLARKVA